MSRPPLTPTARKALDLGADVPVWEGYFVPLRRTGHKVTEWGVRVIYQRQPGAHPDSPTPGEPVRVWKTDGSSSSIQRIGSKWEMLTRWDDDAQAPKTLGFLASLR